MLPLHNIGLLNYKIPTITTIPTILVNRSLIETAKMFMYVTVKLN